MINWLRMIPMNFLGTPAMEMSKTCWGRAAQGRTVRSKLSERWNRWGKGRLQGPTWSTAMLPKWRSGWFEVIWQDSDETWLATSLKTAWGRLDQSESGRERESYVQMAEPPKFWREKWIYNIASLNFGPWINPKAQDMCFLIKQNPCWWILCHMDWWHVKMGNHY